MISDVHKALINQYYPYHLQAFLLIDNSKAVINEIFIEKQCFNKENIT